MQISAQLQNRIHAHISLKPQSRFIGVAGPSGAGKSTLFRTLAGVEKNAKVVTPWAAQKIGIVFQQPMLFPHTDVRGNLALAQRHASANAMSIEACLRGCCCEHLIDKSIHSLSGGEAQRIAIVRALVNGPDVLLLDESLSAIDTFTRRKIYRFLNNLCVSGQLTCFVVSHDLDDLALFSDELVYIDQGRVELCGPTRDVLAQVFDKEAVMTPSSVLEGVKVASRGNASEQLTNVSLSEYPIGSSIERVRVAGYEIFVSEESLSYSSQNDGEEVPVRFAVKACDVSIDTNIADFGSASTISILNALPCTISSIEPVMRPTNASDGAANQAHNNLRTAYSAKVLLKLNVIGSRQTLYARISCISLTRLNLDVGMQVIARFKLP